MGLIEEGMANAKKIGRKEGISIGEKRGEARGITIGEKRGIRKNTLELAKKMLKENIDTDIVSKVTGLSKKILMTML